jgi:hypothetical protein
MNNFLELIDTFKNNLTKEEILLLISFQIKKDKINSKAIDKINEIDNDFLNNAISFFDDLADEWEEKIKDITDNQKLMVATVEQMVKTFEEPKNKIKNYDKFILFITEECKKYNIDYNKYQKVLYKLLKLIKSKGE